MNEEDDAVNFAKTIAEADRPLISAATLVEAGIVMLNRHGSKGARKLNDLIQEAGCQVESLTAQHPQMALEAYAVYGKGQNNKAALNYGDCFSYALAKATDLPLLFKGDDFSQTDIEPALSAEGGQGSRALANCRR